jgi:hypothetical protein
MLRWRGSSVTKTAEEKEKEDLAYRHAKESEMNMTGDPDIDVTRYLQEMIDYYRVQKAEAANVLANPKKFNRFFIRAATLAADAGGKSFRRKSRRRRNRKSTRRRRRKY